MANERQQGPGQKDGRDRSQDRQPGGSSGGHQVSGGRKSQDDDDDSSSMNAPGRSQQDRDRNGNR